MNPIFPLLVLLVAIILWFLLSWLFFPLGRFVSRIWNDAMDEMDRDEVQKEER